MGCKIREIISKEDIDNFVLIISTWMPEEHIGDVSSWTFMSPEAILSLGSHFQM